MKKQIMINHDKFKLLLLCIIFPEKLIMFGFSSGEKRCCHCFGLYILFERKELSLLRKEGNAEKVRGKGVAFRLDV